MLEIVDRLMFKVPSSKFQIAGRFLYNSLLRQKALTNGLFSVIALELETGTRNSEVWHATCIRQ